MRTGFADHCDFVENSYRTGSALRFAAGRHQHQHDAAALPDAPEALAGPRSFQLVAFRPRRKLRDNPDHPARVQNSRSCMPWPYALEQRGLADRGSAPSQVARTLQHSSKNCVVAELSFVCADIHGHDEDHPTLAKRENKHRQPT